MSNTNKTYQKLAKYIETLLGETSSQALERDFKRHAKFCQSKNYREEGIPMYLTLEDVSQKAVSKKKVSKRKSTALSSGDQMVNLMMVETLELFHQQLKRRKKDLRSEDISMILEVLAERYFSFVSFRQWRQ
jgi:hypothetical protein